MHLAFRTIIPASLMLGSGWWAPCMLERRKQTAQTCPAMPISVMSPKSDHELKNYSNRQ